VTLKDLNKAVTGNVREYAMYIALVVIMAIFSIATNGLFLSSRNIAMLLNQSGYIVVLAVGMTLVIVIRHIDLSVGFMAGFLGAVAAIGMTSWGLPSWAMIPVILVLGICGGLLTAFLVAKIGIPAFVATLAGWLIYRGLLLMVTGSTGTIIIPDEGFNALGNGFISDVFPDVISLGGDNELHIITVVAGILAVALFVVSQVRNRKSQQAYNFEVIPTDMFIIQQVFVSIILLAITWILAGFNGLSWTVVITLAVVLIYDWVSNHTVLGRHIYAVGGNPDAAELSGINVKKVTTIVFGSMGFLVAVSGILYASRLQAATQTAGNLFELDAIAAAYIGGVSAAGGVGKITGSLIGGLVYMSLMNGMNLMGTDISLQYILRGAVLALAVIFDVVTRRAKR
jgi:putative multiple sugar transport system permease protein